MSGYRSLKRVLGETNLERKFRWLFGLSIGTLIFLAFFWAGRIARNLIEETAEHKGSDLARVALFNRHWYVFEKDKDARQLQEQLTHELAKEAIDARFLKLDEGPEPPLVSTPLYTAENPEERALLEKLRAEAERQLLARPADALTEPGGPAQDITSEPVFDTRVINGQYHYYQVVQWSSVCKSCHEGMHGAFAESAAASSGSVFDPRSTPFRVIRVTMPYAETRSAINRTSAVLWTVGIITVSLSMVAFYFVVRYVVVKPLTHLRDVSDAVASGDLEQRAEINTNDEFQELAESFNKMLRHLIETQAQLRGANQELDSKVDELAQLNLQLNEMNRLKGEFLALMGHELRTPLNSILGFSEVLQGIESLTDKQKRYVQNIQVSGRRLLEMINDILDLAKMEAGKMEVRLSEFSIEQVIHQQCDLVRSLAEDKNIDLSVDIESDLPLLYQDMTKVQQILTNLLSNAIKFTPEGGRITVGAKGDPRGRVEFWVADTGVGISQADQAIIFEKFRQGKAVLGQDNLTREFSGTGLGLSIVKELCKLLNGEITVESELGKGSIFRVVIPWMRAEQPQAATRLGAKLDEVTKSRRAEMLKGAATLDSLSGEPQATASSST